jgi:hypothetical protein
MNFIAEMAIASGTPNEKYVLANSLESHTPATGVNTSVWHTT